MARLTQHHAPSVPTDDHPTLSGHGDQPVVGTFGVVNGEKRRNRRLLLTTNTELNAMAAPAIRDRKSTRLNSSH